MIITLYFTSFEYSHQVITNQGIKKYGYWYFDKDGNKINNSIFAGVPRDSLSFGEIKDVFIGDTITKNIDNRFYKSFNTLNIDIKNTFITIKNTCDKSLINGEYLPIIINKGKFNLFGYLFNNIFKLKNKLVRCNIKSN